MSTFNSPEYLPDALFASITDIRVSDPECALHHAAARRRRKTLAPAGRLNILAADHPARRVTKVGSDPIAMADRRDYLARILRVLECPEVDGLMATMDIIEELLILDGLRPPLLNDKLLIASLNRGGLAGTAWELDDPITGPSVQTCLDWNLDGAKFLLRLADDTAVSLKTTLAAAQAINDCNRLNLPMFLEPLPVSRVGGNWSVLKTANDLARITGVASALGDSSRNLWLKLPYCDNFKSVARATTLPILLLGGESAGGPEHFLTELSTALQASPNVRGALVGRNILYPGDADPLQAAAAAGAIVHKGFSIEDALQEICK